MDEKKNERQDNLGEIQLGEAIPNEFDYDLELGELDKQLTEKYEHLNREKEGAVTPEWIMLGCALDLVDFAKENLDIALDFSEESLEKLCTVVSMMKESYAEEAPTDDIFATWVNMTAGLFGCIIIKNLGGNWIESNAGMSVIVNGTAAFITNQLVGAISGANPNENAISEMYDYLKKQSGIANTDES